jgi:hypothetical protein
MNQTISTTQPETISEQIVINLTGKDSTLTGTQLKKKLSETFAAKVQSKKDYESTEGGYYPMLKNVIKYGVNFIDEINKKYSLNLTGEILINLQPNELTQFLTPKEIKDAKNKAIKYGKCPEKTPVYSYWVVANLVGRYAKNLYYTSKKLATSKG